MTFTRGKRTHANAQGWKVWALLLSHANTSSCPVAFLANALRSIYSKQIRERARWIQINLLFSEQKLERNKLRGNNWKSEEDEKRFLFVKIHLGYRRNYLVKSTQWLLFPFFSLLEIHWACNVYHTFIVLRHFDHALDSLTRISPFVYSEMSNSHICFRFAGPSSTMSHILKHNEYTCPSLLEIQNAR